MDSRDREIDPVGGDLSDRDVAGEETETPDGLQRGGPTGNTPWGPAVDNPSEGDPRAPRPSDPGRSAPVPDRAGGDAPSSGQDAGGIKDEPITEWVDDDDTEGFGAEQPPGG